MELKTITCPNCGANTTNAENCDYCGSLLVRFVDKGIDLSKTSYTNDTATFPGLAAELKRNLKLQNSNPNEFVATDLFRFNAKTISGDTLSVLRSGMCSWSDSSSININNSKNGLIIVVGFSTHVEYENNRWNIKHNYRQNNRLEKFKKLDCFPLFTSHMSYYDIQGEKMYGREYAIDFGNDAEGAARLISEILQKVYGWTLDTNFDISTEVGIDNVQKARDNWDKAHGFAVDTNNSKSLLDEYWWVIAGLCGWLLLKMIF